MPTVRIIIKAVEPDVVEAVDAAGNDYVLPRALLGSRVKVKDEWDLSIYLATTTST